MEGGPTIEIGGERLPIRPNLATAIEAAWGRLAGAGTWWTGSERLAIAAEVRRARSCELCERRKSAVSPSAIAGRHVATGLLSVDAVEAAHRLATDASRLTAATIQALTDGSLGEEHYVELVAVVAMITALDSFDAGLGRPLRELPEPVGGRPSRLRPAQAVRSLAWVATVQPGAYTESEFDPYKAHGDKNIHQALSLVPAEVASFFDLDVELYLRDHEIRDFSREFRAITHRQIELIAGRTSALNRCFY
ncbi:MAG TPA: alkylhydroperoxidase-related (seleno)protein [Hyphomicrobiaceae bacterium]|nr:alkylhydroperoxidase-related (seleno)protein [Hyphomicrobiaceae bacterium]